MNTLLRLLSCCVILVVLPGVLSGQVFSFECVCRSAMINDSCDICPVTTVKSRSFTGLLIYRNGTPYKWIDEPYTIRRQPGEILEFWEQGPNPDRISINRFQTGFVTMQGFIDSTFCQCRDSSTGGGDGWGSQVVQRDSSLRGNGTTANPLGIKNYTTASNGQVPSKTAGGINWITPLLVEVDGDIFNELQTFSNTSDATSHTLTLSASGGSLQWIEGTGIGLSTGGTSGAGTLTITNTAPDQVVSITGAGINVVTGTYPTFTVTGTEVDGSTTNEGSLTVGAGGANTSTINSNTSGSTNVTVSGSNTVLVTESGSTITVQADTSLVATINDVNAAANRDDSTWIKVGGGYSGKRITTDVYRTGKTGINTTSPTRNLDVTGSARGTLQDRGGAVYNVAAYNIFPNGMDCTTPLRQLLDTIYVNGGGTLQFNKGVYRITGRLKPRWSNQCVGQSVPLKVVGTGAFMQGQLSLGVTAGGTILRYISSDSILWDLRGVGLTEFTGLSMTDTTGGGQKIFIRTTLNTIHCHDVAFFGDKQAYSADDIGVVLGSYRRGISDGLCADGDTSINSGFQGYGTVIRDCFFNGISYGVWGRHNANAVHIVNNTWWNSCGGLAAIRFGTNANFNLSASVLIDGNLFEASWYNYGILMYNSNKAIITGNQFYDHTDTCRYDVYLDQYSTFGYLELPFQNTDTSKVFRDVSATATVFLTEQNVPSRFTQGLRVWKTLIYKDLASQGPITETSANHQFFDRYESTGISRYVLPSGGSATKLYNVRDGGSNTRILQMVGSSGNFIDTDGDLRLRVGGDELYIRTNGDENHLFSNGILYGGLSTTTTPFKMGQGDHIFWSDVSSPTGGSSVGLTSTSAGILRTVNASTVDAEHQADKFTATGTSANKWPVGTTGQRPTAANGLVRYNSSTDKFEGVQATAWTNFITAADLGSYLSGSGANTQMAFFTGTNTLSGSNNNTWNGQYQTIKNSDAGTTYNGTVTMDALRLQNTNSTNGNFSAIASYSQSGSIDGAVVFKHTDHTASTSDFQVYLRGPVQGFGKALHLTGDRQLGINTTPVNTLDVEGGAVIGATYSGTNTAPSNGLLVQGNVAIGNTSASQTLHVQGTARITGSTGTSTSVMGRDGNGDIQAVGIGTGLQLTGGALSVNGVPTGSGSNTQVTYWTGTNTIAGNANFLYNTQYLTIKNTNASTTYNGTVTQDGLRLQNTDATNNNFSMISGYSNGGTIAGAFGYRFVDQTNAYADFEWYNRGSATGFGRAMLLTSEKELLLGTTGTGARLVSRGKGTTSSTFSGIFENNGGTDILTIRDDSRVGVLTASPNRTLEVSGEVRITDLATDTPTKIVGADGDGDLDTVGIGAENELHITSGTLGTNFHTTIAPASLTAGTTNNWNPTGLSTAWVIELSGDDKFEVITGIVAPTFAKTITLYNSGTNSVLFPKEFTTSTAANRFNFELVLFPGKSAQIRYSVSLSRWTLISTADVYRDVEHLYFNTAFNAPVSLTSGDYDFWSVTSEVTASLVAPVAGRMQGVAVNTGIVATGLGYVASKTAFFENDNTAGTATWAYCRAVIKTPANLSNGTQDYTLRIGFNAATGGGGATDGFYFDYNHANVSGNWGCNTTNAGNTQRNNSGIAVAASTVYVLEVIFRPNLLVEFFINGTRVATNDTFIPTGDDMYALAEIQKSIGLTQEALTVYTINPQIAFVK